MGTSLFTHRDTCRREPSALPLMFFLAHSSALLEKEICTASKALSIG